MDKSKKIEIGAVFYLLLWFAACFAGGMILGQYMEQAMAKGNGFFVSFLFLVIVMYVAIYIQIVVHEAGHLVFGLLTGYRFTSFRIGSLMILKEDDKIKLCKFSLAGTGGQCLMAPPDLVEDKIPVVLYNFGGCIFNLLIAGIFIVVGYCVKAVDILYAFSLFMVLIGVVFAASNGIPLKVGLISNDGGNALSLGKNKKAMFAFWLQLKMNEYQAKGIRLKEMPESWFAVPADEDMDNELVAAVAVFRSGWLMDQLRLEEAAKYIEELLAKDCAIVGLYRSLLNCERIYCELVVKKNTSEAIYLHSKEYQKFVKQMKNYPSIIRTEYVYALLAEKDEKEAAKWLERFEQVAKTYPYPSEIEGERELIARVNDERNND